MKGIAQLGGVLLDLGCWRHKPAGSQPEFAILAILLCPHAVISLKDFSWGPSCNGERNSLRQCYDALHAGRPPCSPQVPDHAWLKLQLIRFGGVTNSLSKSFRIYDILHHVDQPGPAERLFYQPSMHTHIPRALERI